MSDSDSLYHRLFGHPIMVEQLVRAFVPEALSVGVDFDRMERVSAKFHARKGERREGDVIWRIPTADGLDLILYLLFEFQSDVDRWMVVRTQVYQGLLWQSLIDERELRGGDRLPPLLLLVLYNGDDRWSAPTRTEEVLAVSPTSPLWPWQPQARYYLLDMGSMGRAAEAQRDNLAALLFRLEQGQEYPKALVALIDEVIGWFRSHPDYAELRALFTELVRQAVRGLGPTVPPVAIPAEMMEIRTMLATQGERWIKKWKAEGAAEGRAEGEMKGRVEGRAEMLLRQFRRKFGEVPAAAVERVRGAGIDQLDEWSERFVDAATLDDVFSDDRPQ